MNLLGIDWGEKYIGLAKKDTKHNIIMPIGYIQNDGSTMFELANIIQQYNIGKIIIGWPSNQKDIQEKIEKFIKELSFVYPNTEIIKVNEDYSSVQAQAKKGNFNRKRGEDDTIAAMQILENYENT